MSSYFSFQEAHLYICSPDHPTYEVKEAIGVGWRRNNKAMGQVTNEGIQPIAKYIYFNYIFKNWGSTEQMDWGQGSICHMTFMSPHFNQ